MTDTHGLAKSVEGNGSITRTVVGHHALNGNSELFVPGNGCFEESCGTFFPFAFQNLSEGETGMIINTDVDILPPHAAHIGWHLAISGNTMAHSIEFSQFFDVDVEYLSGAIAFIADHRLLWLKIAPAVETMAH